MKHSLSTIESKKNTQNCDSSSNSGGGVGMESQCKQWLLLLNGFILSEPNPLPFTPFPPKGFFIVPNGLLFSFDDDDACCSDDDEEKETKHDRVHKVHNSVTEYPQAVNAR